MMFYFRGHGVTDKKYQIMVLNSSIPKDAIYEIQKKLEFISSKTECKVGAFFNCCRVPIVTQSQELAKLLGHKFEAPVDE